MTVSPERLSCTKTFFSETESALKEWLYRNRSVEVFRNKTLKLVCTGGVDNPSGESLRILGEEAGYGCYIPSPDGGRATDDEWFAQMSASGKVTLVCRTKSTRR